MAGTTVEAKAPAPVLAPPPGCLHVAVCPEDAAFRNEIRLARKLRVRVLDCRSGKPVTQCPVQEVLLADEGAAWDATAHAAVRFVGDHNWDIEKNFWINSIQGPKVMFKALEALGYPPDDSGFAAFQAKWYGEKELPKKPEKRAVWYQRIHDAYKQSFNGAVQFHLQALGFLTGSFSIGQWDGPSAEAFRTWQKVELSVKKPAGSLQSLSLATKLKNARKNFWTDEHGVLHIPVPVAKVKAGFQVRITFRDFALVCEGENFRNNADSGIEGCSVEWQDTQDASTGAWGWRVRPNHKDYKNKAISSLPEFCAFLTLHVPAVSDLEKMWRSLKTEALTSARFSPFYAGAEKSGKEAEYVAFALQWCQPVWDEYEAPPPGGSAPYFNHDVYVQNSSELRTHMHVPTVYFDLNGSDPHGGKGYGKYEYSPAPKWRGIHYYRSWSECNDCKEFLAGTRGDPKRWVPGAKYSGSLMHLEVDPALNLPAPPSADSLTLGPEWQDWPAHYWAWDGGNSELCHEVEDERICRRPRSEHFYQLDEEEKELCLAGKLDRNVIKGGHRGIDVHARIGDKVFAMHAGKVTRMHGGMAGRFYHHEVAIGEKKFVLQYLHLSKYVAPNGFVKAGQIIGEAGRDGNLREISEWPGHCHLNLGGDDVLLNWLTDNDPASRVCVPSNETPLLFPCRCDVTQEITALRRGDPSGCQFDDKRFVGGCWAVAELRCPFMAEKPRDDAFRIQAQLRHLWETRGAPFQNPGAVDGDLGTTPGPRARPGKTRTAIHAVHTSVDQESGSYEIDEQFLDILNELAPIAQPS